MSRLKLWVGALLFALGIPVAACNSSEDGRPIDLGLGDMPEAGSPTSPAAAASAAPSGCSGATSSGEALDVSKLPACAPACDGAHCVPGDKVPPAAQAALSACAGGFCVPDSLITSGGAHPASCTSLGGSSGVCLSLCVPQVAANKDALPQATCAANERCAPCVNPTDGKSTGACDIGGPVAPAPATTCGDGGTSSSPPPANNGGSPPPPSDGGTSAVCPHVGPPILDPNTLPACGGANSGAHCLSSSLVPAALTSSLATCSGGYCVPDKLIASGGNFIPPTCASVGGVEGRCQNTALPKVAAQQTTIPQSTCDANERCVPCFNPFDGTDTGACRISCDPGPQKPATVFAACCGPFGKCLPRSLVPASGQQFVQQCDAQGDVCVPTENIDPNFRPMPCSGTIQIPIIGPDYTGVCLSRCLNFGSDGDNLDQGSCDGAHLCVPCINPETEQPTHAPGCP